MLAQTSHNDRCLPPSKLHKTYGHQRCIANRSIHIHVHVFCLCMYVPLEDVECSDLSNRDSRLSGIAKGATLGRTCSMRVLCCIEIPNQTGSVTKIPQCCKNGTHWPCHLIRERNRRWSIPSTVPIVEAVLRDTAG